MTLEIRFLYCFTKLLLLISGIEAKDGKDWHIEVAPRASWVLLESSISTNCLNSTNKITTFASDTRWFKISENADRIKSLPTTLDARVRSNGHQLQIFEAKVDDEGIYCCMPVLNATLSNCNELNIVNLSVAQPPVIVTHKQHKVVKTGANILLNCYVGFVGKPAAKMYTWQRYGKDLELQTSKYSAGNLTDLFILIIHNVTESDEGWYSCLLTNAKYQKANASIYLHVPRIQNGIACST